MMKSMNKARKIDVARMVATVMVIASGVSCALLSAFSNHIFALAMAPLFGLALYCYFLFFAPTVSQAEIPVSVEKAPRKEIIPPDRLDSLTGLANENGLMAWLSEKGARIAADGKGIVIVAADLEDFDKIEQTYGKEVSDAVLIEVARRVATCTGSDGIASRTGGDEFAAIATVVPEDFAEVAADQAGRLAELIQRPVELPSGVIWIGGSVGAAAGMVSEGHAVLANAREALKKAKRLGRGHYVVHKVMSA
jgi:diguanylate cyclase (GGDEF)-like protein